MTHWIDECLAFEKFHKERIAANGEYKNEGKRSKRGWSLRASASAYGISIGKACEDMRLVEFFRLNPALSRKLDFRKEALQILKEHGMAVIGGKNDK